MEAPISRGSPWNLTSYHSQSAGASQDNIVRSPREGPKTVSSYPQDIVEMTGKIQEVDYKIATNPVG